MPQEIFYDIEETSADSALSHSTIVICYAKFTRGKSSRDDLY